MKYTEEMVREMLRASWANNAVEGFVATDEEMERVFQKMKSELIDQGLSIEEVIAKRLNQPDCESRSDSSK